MSDETNSPSTTTASAPATAPAPAATVVAFTPEQQEQVNRIAAAARAEGKQSAERASTATPAVPVPSAQISPAPKVTLESLQADLEKSRLRGSFDKAALKLGIPEDDHDDLFENYQNKPLNQRSTWLEEKAKRLMPTQTTSPAATTSIAGAEQKPAAAPNTPGRVDPITSGGLVDIWNLTPQQLSDIGPQGLRVEFEKHLSAGERMSGRPTRPKAPPR